jgi:putative transposase
MDIELPETRFRGRSETLLYNLRRPHQALANRTPMAVWRDGVTGALGEMAVDMMLRLDNAAALPTYPQPQQQPQLVLFQ